MRVQILRNFGWFGKKQYWCNFRSGTQCLKIHAFFNKQHFWKQHHAEIGKKIKKMLNNILRLNFSYLKIIHILHPSYHSKIIKNIAKNKKKNKYVCFHQIIWLIIMKMKNGNENQIDTKKPRSHKCNMNRPRSVHEHKYSKYKNCLSIIMLLCIKQHLNNIWNLVHEKVRQHEAHLFNQYFCDLKCILVFRKWKRYNLTKFIWLNLVFTSLLIEKNETKFYKALRDYEKNTSTIP